MSAGDSVASLPSPSSSLSNVTLVTRLPRLHNNDAEANTNGETRKCGMGSGHGAEPLHNAGKTPAFQIQDNAQATAAREETQHRPAGHTLPAVAAGAGNTDVDDPDNPDTSCGAPPAEESSECLDAGMLCDLFMAQEYAPPSENMRELRHDEEKALFVAAEQLDSRHTPLGTRAPAEGELMNADHDEIEDTPAAPEPVVVMLRWGHCFSANLDNEDRLYIPHGFVHTGETPLMAAYRLLERETGMSTLSKGRAGDIPSINCKLFIFSCLDCDQRTERPPSGVWIAPADYKELSHPRSGHLKTTPDWLLTCLQVATQWVPQPLFAPTPLAQGALDADAATRPDSGQPRDTRASPPNAGYKCLVLVWHGAALLCELAPAAVTASDHGSPRHRLPSGYLPLADMAPATYAHGTNRFTDVEQLLLRSTGLLTTQATLSRAQDDDTYVCTVLAEFCSYWGREGAPQPPHAWIERDKAKELLSHSHAPPTVLGMIGARAATHATRHTTSAATLLRGTIDHTTVDPSNTSLVVTTIAKVMGTTENDGDALGAPDRFLVTYSGNHVSFPERLARPASPLTDPGNANGVEPPALVARRALLEDAGMGLAATDVVISRGYTLSTQSGRANLHTTALVDAGTAILTSTDRAAHYGQLVDIEWLRQLVDTQGPQPGGHDRRAGAVEAFHILAIQELGGTARKTQPPQSDPPARANQSLGS